jgi:hypothetical protein
MLLCCIMYVAHCCISLEPAHAPGFRADNDRFNCSKSWGDGCRAFHPSILSIIRGLLPCKSAFGKEMILMVSLAFHRALETILCKKSEWFGDGDFTRFY